MCYSLLQDFHIMQVCPNDGIIEERSGTKELSGTIKTFEYKKKKKKEKKCCEVLYSLRKKIRQIM